MSYPTKNQWVITQSFAASHCLIILHNLIQYGLAIHIPFLPLASWVKVIINIGSPADKLPCFANELTHMLTDRGDSITSSDDVHDV